VAYEDVMVVLKEELGRDPSEVFESIGADAIASASIA